MFQGSEPLAAAVSHHPLGTDKLDYLARDGTYTGAPVQVPIDKVLNYTLWTERGLVIDSKILEEVMRLQDSYVYMYLRIYLRRPVQILDRYRQKMIARLMTDPDQGRALAEERYWEMVDAELDAALISQVPSMFRRLVERRLPKTAIVLRLPRFEKLERIRNKAITVFPVDEGTLRQFDQFRRPQKAAPLEAKIAELAGIPEEAVVICPVVHSERFVPKDILVDYGNGTIEPLERMFPRHIASLRERAEAYLAVRVAVFDEHRAQVAEPSMARKIYELLVQTPQPLSLD